MIKFLRRTFRRKKRPVFSKNSLSNTGHHIPAPANVKKHFKAVVVLLDGADVSIDIPKASNGDYLFNKIIDYHREIPLSEAGYFGLQYIDQFSVPHWLDHNKQVKKQLKIGPPFTLHFRLKFYPSEPNLLKDDYTRYQVFLQVKQDLLLRDRLADAPYNTAIELAALSLQSELGNYDSNIHTPYYISEFRFIHESKQTETFELDTLDLYQTHSGKTPAKAELEFLNKAKWLEMYGVDTHEVIAKDGQKYDLGLTPTGVLLYERLTAGGRKKIGLFFWNKIKKLNFESKVLKLCVAEELADGNERVHTFNFQTVSQKACKHLWKCAVEHHQFFRLKSQTDGNVKSGRFGIRTSSRFGFKGPTEAQLTVSNNAFKRSSTGTFARRPSKRYSRRASFSSFKNTRAEKTDKLSKIQQANQSLGMVSNSHTNLLVRDRSFNNFM